MGKTAQNTICGVLAIFPINRLLALFLAFGVCAQGTAQIRVGVWTDRPVYHYGDTVRITVTAFNASSDTAHLSFSTSVQGSYIFDDYDFYAKNPAQMIVTSRTIPPSSSVSWDYLRYPWGPGDSSLSVGTHALVGEVLGYGRSDTMTIVVTKENSTSVAEHGATSESFMLNQNYPNPFNPSTTITYGLPKASVVRLSVYDLLGREVSVLVSERKNAGSHQVKFDGAALPSGVYFYRLQAEAFTKTRSFCLIR